MSVALMSVGSNNKIKPFNEYEKVLLWSNNSTDGFPGQTVTFTGADYGVYFVQGSKYTTGTNLSNSMYVIAGQETILMDALTEQRRVTITKGKAGFSYGGGGNNWSNSTVYCPRRIYGLKGTEQ